MSYSPPLVNHAPTAKSQVALTKMTKHQHSLSSDPPQTRTLEDPSQETSMEDSSPDREIGDQLEAEPLVVKMDNVRLASSDTLDILFLIYQKQAMKYEKKTTESAI